MKPDLFNCDSVFQRPCIRRFSLLEGGRIKKFKGNRARSHPKCDGGWDVSNERRRRIRSKLYSSLKE